VDALKARYLECGSLQLGIMRLEECGSLKLRAIIT
jgi:hypothetical protein